MDPLLQFLINNEEEKEEKRKERRKEGEEVEDRWMSPSLPLRPASPLPVTNLNFQE
jgi:hypothetical protein